MSISVATSTALPIRTENSPQITPVNCQPAQVKPGFARCQYETSYTLRYGLIGYRMCASRLRSIKRILKHITLHFKSSLSTADLSSLCLLTASDFFIATSNDMKDDSAAWPARPLLPLLLVSVHHHRPLRLLSGDAVVFSLRLNQADQGQKPSGCLCLRLLISHHQQRQEM
jgi:hypothetical protein